jgi:hypothetical protein
MSADETQSRASVAAVAVAPRSSPSTKRHLAKNAAGAELNEQPISEGYMHCATLNDVQFSGRVSESKDRLPGFEGAKRDFRTDKKGEIAVSARASDIQVNP